jgi:hypothetical protein
MILLTLASVNNFTKNEFEEEIFYAIFFLFILYYYLPFLDGNKKTLHYIFAFNNNSPHIKHIAKKKKSTNTKKKIKQSVRGPQINQQRPQNIFRIFCYRKEVRLVKYQIRMGIKIMAKA